jgi:hypothetical protein
MKNLTTRLAFRALFAIVMQTEVHADETHGLIADPPILCGEGTGTTCAYISDTSTNGPYMCEFNVPGYALFCWPAPKDCAPGYEQACQQRDHGTDGLRRSEQR